MKTTSLSLLALALAACGGDGGGDRIARPDELRISIIRGRIQTGQVRAAGGAMALAGPSAQINPAEVLPDPVVVRVSVLASPSLSAGPTGPSLDTEIPPGAIINWRVIGEGCGAPFAGVTALEASDSVVNYWRRGTKAGAECKMVAEGVTGGQAFGSDTARATFTAGPASPTFRFVAPLCTSPCTLPAAAVVDAHGNPVPYRIVTDDVLTAAGETVGTVEGRTVTFEARGESLPDRTVDLLGEGGAVVARMRYRVTNGDPELQASTSGTALNP